MTATTIPSTLDAATTPNAAGHLAVGGHWTGFGGAHGGLLVAAAARSMDGAVGGDRTLRSIHVDLRGAVAPGVLELDAALDREGRSVSFASVTGRQAGRERFSATGVYGAGGTPVDYGPVTRGVFPDGMPGVDAAEPWSTEGTPALRTVEYRPATTNLPTGNSGLAEFHVWMRIVGDDAPVDQTRALTLLDAPAPGLYGTVSQPFPIPTVELTAHLLPALDTTTSPWVLARMQTVVAAEGYSVDDCELWSEGGELMALARQLRRAIVL